MNARAVAAKEGTLSARAMNRLATLCVALAVLAIVAAALYRAAQQPKFQLKRIDVHGELQHVTAASARAALAGRVRGNYFTWRLDDARRLFETVPWVAGASVRRVWPDRLLVTLTEHRALGVWEDGRLLSDRGELFVANPDEAEIYGALPEFSGPPRVAKDAARQYYRLAAQFATLQLRIDAIDISDRKAWALQLSSESTNETARARPTRVELGRDETAGGDGKVEGKSAMTRRVAQLIAAYPSMVTQLGGAPARIDARYANGFVALPPARLVMTTPPRTPAP